MTIAFVLVVLAQPAFACGTTPQRPCYTRAIDTPPVDAGPPRFASDLGGIHVPAGASLFIDGSDGDDRSYIFATPVPCVCRCSAGQAPTLHVIDRQVRCPSCPAAPPCSHDHGFEKIGWGALAVGSCAALYTLLEFLVRFDRVVGAWRRAELPKRWWWSPLAWLGEKLLIVSMTLGLLMLSKAMGW